jgi:hypothetical protein
VGRPGGGVGGPPQRGGGVGGGAVCEGQRGGVGGEERCVLRVEGARGCGYEWGERVLRRGVAEEQRGEERRVRADGEQRPARACQVRWLPGGDGGRGRGREDGGRREPGCGATARREGP